MRRNGNARLQRGMRRALACAGAGLLVAAACTAAAQPAQAEGYSIQSAYSSGNKVAKDKESWSKYYAVQVEVGAKSVHFGDFIQVRKGSAQRGMLSYYKGATYSSSKKSVASINKKTGLVKVKKKGTFTLKASYKGKKVQVKFKAVKKGAFKKYRKKAGSKNLAYNKKLAKKCTKKYKKYLGKKVTKKNRDALLTIWKTMQLKAKLSSSARASSDWYRTGSVTLVREEPVWGTYRHWKTHTMLLYAPECAHAEALGQALSDYAAALNPYGSSKAFKIVSASGSGKTATFKLASKVTGDQLFGAKYAGSSVPKAGASTAKRKVVAQSNSQVVEGVLKAKAGSDVLTATFSKSLKPGDGYHLDSDAYAPGEEQSFFGVPEEACRDEDDRATPPATWFVAQ